jgi:hypothetical protein
VSAGRLIPEGPLPPYAHVPGRTPHPVSDPRGHSFGAAPERPAAPDPDDWLSCRVYLRGLELFNGGYYWEAHEAWESLWHACGRAGPAADFLKGLIKLAAAGVKVREGRPRGVVAHARAAAQLFRRIPQERYFGLRVDELTRCADGIADHPPASADPAAPVEVVFPFTLRPESP